MPTHSSSASLAFVAGLGAFVATVVAAAVVGIVLAVALISAPAGAHDAAHAEGPWGVGDDVPTSFGFVAVEHAETLKGLGAKELGGAVHGIGSFVGRERALVKAAVTLRNGPVRTLDYSPEWFSLRATAKDGKVRRYPLSHASIRPGVLQPDAAVDASLGFTIPRNGARLAIEFKDPGRQAPLVIDLDAKVGKATAADKRASKHGH
jgi:hypothetical protein